MRRSAATKFYAVEPGVNGVGVSADPAARVDVGIVLTLVSFNRTVTMPGHAELADPQQLRGRLLSSTTTACNYAPRSRGVCSR